MHCGLLSRTVQNTKRVSGDHRPSSDDEDVAAAEAATGDATRVATCVVVGGLTLLMVLTILIWTLTWR